MKSPLHVTQSFLPPQEEVFSLLATCWQTGQLTNQGPLLTRLEAELATYTKMPHALCLTNGTVAIEEALLALGIDSGEVITTPFSFVATLDAVLRRGCAPVFADIDPQTLCIDPRAVEKKITPRTRAILAVHVFGNLCDVEALDAIAKKHKLALIYDAAHSFGSFHGGGSSFRHGDISTCSFHATKVFHTGEGGACFTSNAALAQKIGRQRAFGLVNAMPESLGTNAKMSELHAALGLANLPHLGEILARREQACTLYDRLLPGLQRPLYTVEEARNHAYYPVIFASEAALLRAVAALNDDNIFPRRYFHPALNTVPFLKERQPCPVAEDIAARILCLPLSAETTEEEAQRVISLLLKKET